MSDRASFSFGWVVGSLLIFLAVEVVLAGLIGTFVGGFLSPGTAFSIKGLLNLVSYLIGGLIVGAASKNIRMLEPAIGAFLAVALTLMLTFFTPYTFLAFSSVKLVIGGGIAFVLALVGATVGEQLTGSVSA